MKRLFNKLINSESGQSLVLFALIASVLFGFAAISIDYAVLSHEKRLLQTMADAAALAGAQVSDDASKDVKTTAIDYAKNNGLIYNENDIKQDDDIIKVNPKYQEDTSKVEVIITRTVKNSFARIINIDESDVSARAVAENVVVYEESDSNTCDQGDFGLLSGGSIKLNGSTLEIFCHTHSNNNIDLSQAKGTLNGNLTAAGNITKAYNSTHTVVGVEKEKTKQETITLPIIDKIPEMNLEKIKKIPGIKIFNEGQTFNGNYVGPILVNGNLKINSTTNIKGNLYVNGNLEFDGGSTLTSEGSVTIKENIEFMGRVFYSSGSVMAGGSLKTDGGSAFKSGGSVATNSYIKIGGSGSFESSGSVITGGNLETDGGSTFKSGGSVAANGNITIRGKSFEASGLLNAGGSLIKGWESIFTSGGPVKANNNVEFSGGIINVNTGSNNAGDLPIKKSSKTRLVE